MTQAGQHSMMGGVKLPYDAEVEYLQGDGNAYISTGVVPPKNSVVSMSLTVGFASGSSMRRFLASDGAETYTHYCDISATNQFGAPGAYTSPVLSADTLYSATMEIEGATRANYSIVSGGTTYTSTTIDFRSGYFGELLLFRISTRYAGSGQRIGACKIYVNGVLVRYYIPVRVGTTGYLYDRVSGKLFGNAGTGVFGYGNDK